MENGIIPQIAALLTQVVQGVAVDSGAGAVANNFMPLLQKFIQSFLEEGLDSLIDARDSQGNKIRASHYSRGRNAVEGAYYARLRRIAGSKKTMDSYVSDDRDQAIKSFFMATGMDKKTAEDQLSTPSGFVARMVYSVLDKGETERAYTTINNAMARRFDLMSDPRGGNITPARRQEYTAAVIKNLRDDFYNRSFGSMGLGDVSQLLQQLVGTGEYDRVGKDLEVSTSRLRRELKEYGKAFESLRSVFSGDMRDVIASMDKLAGGSALALTPAELQHTAKLYQHAALVTGISDRNLMSLTKTMYTQGVGQGGGDERFAANAAVLSSYILSSKSITTPGVTQVDLERSMARMAGEVAASGETREMAAAYRAYLDTTKNKDTTENFNAFQKALQESGADASTFGRKLYREAGMSEQSYNEMAASYAVGSMASDARMMSASFARRISATREQYTSVQDRVVKALGFKTEEEAKKALGDDWRSTNAIDLYKRIGAATVGASGDIGKARAILVTGVRDIAWRHGFDWYTVAELLTRTDTSDRLRKAALGDVKEFENARLAPGVAGLMQYMKMAGNKANVSGALAALFFGVSVRPPREKGAEKDAGVPDGWEEFAANHPAQWKVVKQKLAELDKLGKGKGKLPEAEQAKKARLVDDIRTEIEKTGIKANVDATTFRLILRKTSESERSSSSDNGSGLGAENNAGQKHGVNSRVISVTDQEVMISELRDQRTEIVGLLVEVVEQLKNMRA